LTADVELVLAGFGGSGHENKAATGGKSAGDAVATRPCEGREALSEMMRERIRIFPRLGRQAPKELIVGGGRAIESSPDDFDPTQYVAAAGAISSIASRTAKES
jgi:hypothetical protein